MRPSPEAGSRGKSRSQRRQLSKREYAAVQRATTQAQRTIHAGTKKSGGGLATALPVLSHAIDRELAGQGIFTHTLHTLGGKVAGSPLRFAIAPLTVPNILSTIPHVGEYPGKLAKNTTRDLFDLPANAIPSFYLPGKKLAHGDVGGALDMLAKPFKETAKHPGRSFSEHPLNTALLVYGAKAGLGRGIGAGGRRVGVKAFDYRNRPSRTLAGTTLTERREWSPDVFAKAHQVMRERRKTKKAAQKREQAQRAREQGHDERALSLERQAQRVDPLAINPREVRRRMDERADVNWQVSHGRRPQMLKQVKDTGVLGRRRVLRGGKRAPDPTASLVVQNIAKATPEDLLAYAREIEAEMPNLDAAGRAANRRLRKQIVKAAKGGVDRERVEAAAEAYRKVTDPLESGLVDAKLLSAGQADRAKLIPYAVRRMGAKHDPKTDRVTANGRTLTNEQIREHMRSTNTPEPSFVTQAPNMRGARNFYRSSEEPVRFTTARRTGEATRRGTFDADPMTLAEQVVRMQQTVDAHKGFQGMVGEFAQRGKTGRVRTFQTYKQAQKAAANLGAEDGGVAWRPVRINPFGGKREQLEGLLERTADPAEHKAVLDAIDDALTATDGPGPWALIPEEAAVRLRDHVNVLGPSGAGKAAGAVSKAFRKTVLATNPKWLFGNVAEAGLRTALNRATPLDLVRYRKTMGELKRIDPAAAEQAGVRAVGGGHYGMTSRLPTRTAEQFEHTNLETAARALGAFRRVPGVKQAADLWEATTHVVFDRINRPLENMFQEAMAGRYIRTRLMPPNAIKTSRRAIEDAAKGLTGTDAQVAMGRYVDRAYGKYSKFSPDARRWLANYTPFAAWTLNAMKFVFNVLPKDHPVALALLASANTATEEWRREQGLQKGRGKESMPGWLQGTIPVAGGGHLPLSRYTPFGAFSDPLGGAAGLVLPQAEGVLMAMRGMDWKGDPLPNGEDDTVKAKAAVKAAIEAVVPFLGQGGRVKEKGVRALNPLAAYPPSKKRKKKGSTPSLPTLPALPPLPALPAVGGS